MGRHRRKRGPMNDHTTHAFLTDGGFEFRGGAWHRVPFNLGELATVDDFIDRIFVPSRLVWFRSQAITERAQAILSGSSERYEIQTPDDRDYYTITRKADGMKLSVNTFHSVRLARNRVIVAVVRRLDFIAF